MKVQQINRFTLTVTLMLLSLVTFAQNVGISSTGATPDASAMLDVVATDKGVLIPRVALTITTSSSPVTSPVASLLVYNTATANDVTPGFYYWNGTIWLRFSANSGFTHFQVFIANGAFTVPSGISQVMLEAWGAGGGGSTGSFLGGGGGGYGKIVANVSPADVLTVTIGTGGSAGATGGGNGTDGGASAVVNPASQTLISAGGGLAAVIGNNGGTTTVLANTTIVPYSTIASGGNGNNITNSWSGGNAAGGGGQGGSSVNTNFKNGIIPGGGGSGNNGAGTIIGTGANGRVIIWW